MSNKKNIISIVVLVVVALVAFWGGMAYGKKSNMSMRQGGARTAQFGAAGAGANFGATGAGRGAGMGGFTTGEVLSKDDKSITLKLSNGGSKIVFFNPSTKISKTVDGTASDLATGTSVSVMGAANADGSINAQSVQIRPVMPAQTPATTPVTQ